MYIYISRLIFTSSFLLEKGVDVEDLGFDYTNEIVSFVQKINLNIMEKMSKMSFEE